MKTISGLLTSSKIFLMVLALSACQTPDNKIIDFETSFTTTIDSRPVFSWKIKSDTHGFLQNSYQIVIASKLEDIQNDKGYIWDSGKRTNRNNSHIKYDGQQLIAGEKYFTKIKVWDEQNKSFESAAHDFITPLHYPADWNAEWITYDYNQDAPLPVFKKIIQLEKAAQVERARLYISAPGYYEAYLNGEKIGDNVLDPGQTNFDDYTFYTAYDIEVDSIKKPFTLGVMLGNGWYNQNVVWGKEMIYGQPVLIAQMVIQFKDGTSVKIGTDESWQWKPGPITFSNVYAGETYNANLEVGDWFDIESTASWDIALLSDHHPGELLEQYAEPIQKMDELSAKGIIKKKDGKYIFDFGQNISGWVKLEIQGEKGQEITIRCVEELDDNGQIDPRTTGIRATNIIQTQKYICKGVGKEIWEPKFTYFGFRYAEVEGLTDQPANDLLTAVVVYSSLEKVGKFICSEENINKLHELADWTIKSNIHSIPTDCPHREKCGWTGDAHALVHALMYNYNAQKFVSKYVFDMRSSARNTNNELYFGNNFHDRSIIKKPKGIPTMIVPGKRTSGIASADWGTAMTQLPLSLYLYYGDEIVLNNFYNDMKVWVNYIHEKMEDGIIKHGLGDWCPPGGNNNMECPIPLSSSAFHIVDLKNIAQAAKVLGNEMDYNYYSQLHKDAIMSFNNTFFDPVNNTYGSQTANVMALDIGIVPESKKQKVAESVVQNIHENSDGFINTGIFGISRIFKALAENGEEDEVYRLLTKKGDNSFACMWERYDATTLWEVLPITEQEDEMAFISHSHPMQSGYDAWFYSGIAGINPSPKNPGFSKIVFKPYLTKFLDHANASYDSPYGTIISKWENNGEQLIWKIQIPENAKGEIYLPNYENNVLVRLNGKPLKINQFNNDFTYLGEYNSGEYLIEMQIL